MEGEVQRHRDDAQRQGRLIVREDDVLGGVE
jgi:hypothetical protein